MNKKKLGENFVNVALIEIILGNTTDFIAYLVMTFHPFQFYTYSEDFGFDEMILEGFHCTKPSSFAVSH